MASIRLTPTEQQLLEELVFLGKFKSVSEAIRYGMDCLFRDFHAKDQAWKAISRERAEMPGRRRKEGTARGPVKQSR